MSGTQCSSGGLNRTGGGLLYQVSQGGCSYVARGTGVSLAQLRFRPSFGPASVLPLQPRCGPAVASYQWNRRNDYLFHGRRLRRLSRPIFLASATYPNESSPLPSLYTKDFVNNAEAVIHRDKNIVQVLKKNTRYPARTSEVRHARSATHAAISTSTR